MNRTKTRRGRQDYHIGQRDGLFVGIEADKLMFFGNLDAVRVLLFQVPQAPLQMVFKHIRHGHEFDPAGGAERLIGRARTATAAANERDSQSVAPGGKGAAFESQAAEQCPAGNGGGSFLEEFPARRRRRRVGMVQVFHGFAG